MPCEGRNSGSGSSACPGRGWRAPRRRLGDSTDLGAAGDTTPGAPGPDAGGGSVASRPGDGSRAGGAPGMRLDSCGSTAPGWGLGWEGSRGNPGQLPAVPVSLGVTPPSPAPTLEGRRGVRAGAAPPPGIRARGPAAHPAGNGTGHAAVAEGPHTPSSPPGQRVAPAPFQPLAPVAATTPSPPHLVPDFSKAVLRPWDGFSVIPRGWQGTVVGCPPPVPLLLLPRDVTGARAGSGGSGTGLQRERPR